MKGSIYAIIDNDTYEIYIGSTIQGIELRYSKHMTDLRMYLGLGNKTRNYRTSFDILVKDDYKVVCIHNFDNLKDMTELKLFEALYMLKFRKQGLKVINTALPNSEAKTFNYNNFGLKEINFASPSLFKNRPLLI